MLCRYHAHSPRLVVVFQNLLIDAILASSKMLSVFYFKQKGFVKM